MDSAKIALAGELSLGLLDGDERRDALRALDTDPEMRSLLHSWNEHFVWLYERDSTADVPPPARVLAGIEARLFAEPAVPSPWARALAALRAPENRDVVILVAMAKLALLAWLLYLFL